MKISARNKLKGKITAIHEGAVNGVVVIDLGGQSVKSDITMEAIKELGLTSGKEACAIIKAALQYDSLQRRAGSFCGMAAKHYSQRGCFRNRSRNASGKT